jgi:hypothetical protein
MTGNLLPAPRCAYCSEIVGVYEPLVLLLPGRQIRKSSRLAEGTLPADGILLHGTCYDQGVGSLDG